MGGWGAGPDALPGGLLVPFLCHKSHKQHMPGEMNLTLRGTVIRHGTTTSGLGLYTG